MMNSILKKLPVTGGALLIILISQQAQAIPAFARKYNTNCVLCHTNEPRLSAFGQQFKENGYQMPGSSDGGTTAKHTFDAQQGPVTIDDISKIMAIRVRGDVQGASFKEETVAMKAIGVGEQVDVEIPKIVNFYFGGTAKADLSYFLEAEYNTQEGSEAAVRFERGFLQFSNIGKKQSALNLQVGKFDPSGLFAFPTHRQQINPIGPKAESDRFPPAINRLPLLPLAFASKMFGLTKGPGLSGSEGYAILPVEPLLYNAPSQTGIALHGRPGGFGSHFMYQVGMATNDKVNINGDRENRYDAYVMGRFDWMTSKGGSMQVSAFYYAAPDAAIQTLNMGGTVVYADNATDITRWGIGARGQWQKLDIYATYIVDEIDAPTWGNSGNAAAANSVWETEASGFSVEADWRVSKRWMFGTRYDWMAPGGLKQLPAGSNLPLNIDASFIAPILKYYPHPNIGLYARAHINLESDQKNPIGGGVDEHPLTNLRSMTTVGVDMAF